MIPLDPSAGFALPAAILALVVVGFLVTGGFFVARQESLVGLAAANGAVALYVAERGMADVLARPGLVAGLAVWDSAALSDTIDDAVVEVAVTRTADRLFFLDARSTVGREAPRTRATRRLGLMARLVPAERGRPARLRPLASRSWVDLSVPEPGISGAGVHQMFTNSFGSMESPKSS